MRKALLLTAASVIALCPGGVVAFGAGAATSSARLHAFPTPKSAKLLWNQNADYAGEAIGSQNFTGGSSSAFNAQGADDFVVPKGKTWKITEIDVGGLYFEGSGPAASENVIFYKDKQGEPDKPVRSGVYTNLVGTNGPNFSIVLPGEGLKLKSGHYWLSVIANIDFLTGGDWGWNANTKQRGYQAMWQNPNGGWGICPTWGTIEDCAGSPGPDFMFDLKGTSK